MIKDNLIDLKNTDIGSFFEQEIVFPKWVTELEGNAAAVVVYCIYRFIGKKFSKSDLNFYENNGSTPNKVMNHLQSIGLEVKVPKFVSHQTISKGLKSGKLTFLTFLNPKSKELCLTFIKGYDRCNDKLISFSDKGFAPVELSQLDVKHGFTVQIPINNQRP